MKKFWPLVAALLLLTACTPGASSPRTLESTTVQPTRQGGATLPPCGATPLKLSPVRVENIANLGPLGSLVPPDHVFPTPHMYFYVKNPGKSDIESPVFAPADIVFMSIALRHYDMLGPKKDYTDYTLVFSVCDGLDMYFHHVRSLTHPALVKALAQGCTPQGKGNEKFCQFEVHVAVAAGEQIATTGDSVAGVGGLDMGARDYRLTTGRSAFANPDRWCPANGRGNIYDRCFTVCPLNYLSVADREPLLGLFGDGRGVVRSEEPRCGDVYHDIAGTAQGMWFPRAKSSDQSPEGQNLYLGPSAFGGAAYEFSMGTSVPGAQAGQYLFKPQATGNVNRRFPEIKDVSVYCFDALSNDLGSLLNGQSNRQYRYSLLLQLASDGRTLSMELRDAQACGAGPWTLSVAASAFER